MLSLRLEGETDDEFRHRAERAALYAKALVEACLENVEVQEMIADPDDPHTEASLRRNPIVRIDYEQAICIATIGEGLYATRSKSWGSGPNILPLEKDDPVQGTRIIYIFKESSVYNRRFLQRRKIKDLLGKKYRKLVGEAKTRKAIFLENLLPEHALAIRRILGVDPALFWRTCRGKTFLDLPDKPLGTVNDEDIRWLPPKARQLPLFRMGPRTREDFAAATTNEG